MSNVSTKKKVEKPVESDSVEAPVMRKADGSSGKMDSVQSAFGKLSGSSGSPLPGPIQRKFESSLGADLSNVRVHTGSASQQAASAVSAKAFATGQDIHFNSGQYNPGSQDGEKLLAHEVAHTVQQSGGSKGTQFKLNVSQPGDALELEADRAADAMVSGERTEVSRASMAAIMRQEINPLTGMPELPRPRYWEDAVGDGEIDSYWYGAPKFLRPVHGLDARSTEWAQDVLRKQAAFKDVWASALGNWNVTVPVYKDYKLASKDAENKGLGDFGQEFDDIDIDAKMETFGTKTSVMEALQQDEDKIGANDKSYNTKKLSRELRKEVREKKKAKKNAERDLGKTKRGISNAKGEVIKAGNAITRAVNNLTIKKESERKAELEKKIQRYQTRAKVIDGALGTIGGIGKAVASRDPGDAIDAGVSALQFINTAAWEAAIADIRSSINAIDGNIADLEQENLATIIQDKKIELAQRLNDLQDAIDAYKKQCGVVKDTHADLAETMEKAALKSGSSRKQAERVRVAVEAVPLIRLALSKCQSVASTVSPPSENPDARVGAGMCTNFSEFKARAGSLKTAKVVADNNVKYWSKRLDIVSAMIDRAN